MRSVGTYSRGRRDTRTPRGAQPCLSFQARRSDGGGCCDCGDLASWAKDGCCPAHAPVDTSGRPAVPARVERRVASVFDWVLHVLLWTLMRLGSANVPSLMSSTTGENAVVTIARAGTSILSSSQRCHAQERTWLPYSFQQFLAIRAVLQCFEWLAAVSVVSAVRKGICASLSNDGVAPLEALGIDRDDNGDGPEELSPVSVLMVQALGRRDDPRPDSLGSVRERHA